MRIPIWPGVRLSVWVKQNPDAVRVVMPSYHKPFTVRRALSKRGWMFLYVRYDWRSRGVPVEHVGPDGLTAAERQRKTISSVLEQHMPEMGVAQRWSITLAVQEALASLPVEVHRVSDEGLDGIVDEVRRGD
ncbi:hypothetical protein [Streptomyces sp. NPDC001658]